MQIYINGIEINGIYTGSASNYTYSKNLGSIGKAWDPNAFFAGQIDDFRIYDRVLSSEEVNVLFAEY